jgi:hypothetical protein
VVELIETFELTLMVQLRGTLCFVEQGVLYS